MTDTVSNEIRSRNMAAIRSKDTKPEMFVRSLIHTAGYRYRLHKKDLPGKPDIFLKKYNAVIFIHGCFWHQHPGCKYAATPKSNEEFWHQKLKGNAKRDRKHIRDIKKIGYRVLTMWECEIKLANKDGGRKLLKKIGKWLSEQS